MKRIVLTVVAVAAAVVSMGGCAVYGPPPAYYGQGGYYGQGAYYQPQPVYVAPAPVYVGPPVTVGFGFGYWGGGRRRW